MHTLDSLTKTEPPAFYSYRSTFSIENATTRFINNSAANGGAMALLSSTLELVNPPN